MNVRALLASPLGFLIGVSLGAIGGGGSILAVPVLVYVAGQTAKEATATSLVVVGLTALAGMVQHHRAGNVRLVPGMLFGLAGVGGSLAGTALNKAVDPEVLLLAFSGVMLVAAWAMWRRGRRGTLEEEIEEATEDALAAGQAPAVTRVRVDPATVVKVLVAGSAVGFLTGFFGVGGGFVIVPALVLALGFTMTEAVGTSLLVIAINSAVALYLRTRTGSSLDWGAAVPFTVAALLGVTAGSYVARRVHPDRLVGWFAALLVGVACYTAAKSAVAIW